MFSRNTVFVLGAGASWHYGYPTGEELVRRVKEEAYKIKKGYNEVGRNNRTAYQSPGTYPKFLYDKNGSVIRQKFRSFYESISQLIKKIEAANPLVIDDFLGMNKDIQEVGKLLIAMVLRECEKNEQIRPISETNAFTRIADVQGIGRDSVETLTEYPARGDWIRFITHQLTVNCTDPSQLLENPVTFVTFNYDMSLENHLHEALKNYTFFAEGGQSNRFLEKSDEYPEGRVLHIYGQLYPFSTTGKKEKSYNNDFKLANEIDYAFDAAKNIHTIAPGEKGLEKETIAAATKAILEAEYVYFLGYGFDSRNNMLLELQSIRDKNTITKYIKITNYRNSDKITNSLNSTLIGYGSNMLSINKPSDITPLERQVDIGGTHLDGYHSIRDHNQPIHIQKSIKNVYDALAEDFEFPD